MSRNLSKGLERASMARIYADESVKVAIVEGLKRRALDREHYGIIYVTLLFKPGCNLSISQP